MTFEIGQRVRLLSTGEVGIVVSRWWDEEVAADDYYIAFVGADWPQGKPSKAPYVLRYAGSSLEPFSK